ncbi:Allergen Tha p 2 [Pseudolycoriella hygida]|uniref:Allergen Tha p 2 n=1 Tax=Pseudolycoriella hygida TaxID=35572 RepID=A0A9Q0S0D7_9DIPT|nr:Allergen Tha p 2 [Pseudolycoriella hygida]
MRTKMLALKVFCAAIALVAMFTTNADATAYPNGNPWGCYNGYCYTYCSNPLVVESWCYTTKGSRYDRQWVACNENAECSQGWKCGGSYSYGALSPAACYRVLCAPAIVYGYGRSCHLLQSLIHLYQSISSSVPSLMHHPVLKAKSESNDVVRC